MKKGKLTFLEPEDVREGDFIWLPRGVRAGIGTLRKNGLSISKSRRPGLHRNTSSVDTAAALSGYRSGPLLMYVYGNTVQWSMPTPEEIDAWRKSFDGSVDTEPIPTRRQLVQVSMTCVPLEASASGGLAAFVASYIGSGVSGAKVRKDAVDEIERKAYAGPDRTKTSTPMLNLTEESGTLDHIRLLVGCFFAQRSYVGFDDLNVAPERGSDRRRKTLVDVACSVSPCLWNPDGSSGNLHAGAYPEGLNLRLVPLGFLKYLAQRHDAKFIRASGTAKAFADCFLATSYRNYAEAVGKVDGLLSESVGKIRKCMTLIHRQAEKAKAFAERNKDGTSSYDGLVRMIKEGVTDA